MKAVICTKYGPPEVLELREVEKPVPKNDQVLIKMHATAVTTSDCIVRGGKVPPSLWLPMAISIGFTKPQQPVLGIVLAGVVEKTGKNVLLFKEGDQVFGWDLFPTFSAYAEYKSMSEKRMLVKKPDKLSFEEAAAIPYGGIMALPFLKKKEIFRTEKECLFMVHQERLGQLLYKFVNFME